MGEPTDATMEPTDATMEPTDATMEPTDATMEPTDATMEPTDATPEPTDAAPETTEAFDDCPETTCECEDSFTAEVTKDMFGCDECKCVPNFCTCINGCQRSTQSCQVDPEAPCDDKYTEDGENFYSKLPCIPPPVEL